MKHTSKLFAAIAVIALMVVGAIASAQSVLPLVANVNPTADRVQIIPNGQPSAQSVYATPAEAANLSVYYKSAAVVSSGLAASAYTHVFGNYEQYATFNVNGSAITYLYLQTAPAPNDGARECAFSVPGVTTLYWTANTGQTIDNAITSISAATGACYVYSASNLTWDRN